MFKMRKRQKSQGKSIENVKTHGQSTGSEEEIGETAMTRWKTLLGFEPKDLLGWQSLVRLLNEPRDPSSLAVTRILFGEYICNNVYVGVYNIFYSKKDYPVSIL